MQCRSKVCFINCKKKLCATVWSLATTFSEISRWLTDSNSIDSSPLSTYSLSGTTPSSTLNFKSFIGARINSHPFLSAYWTHFNMVSHNRTSPFFSGGFQAMAMCFLPASVTCRSRGGEGGP